jgi:tetratricopeptide (TPR) repeat protein
MNDPWDAGTEPVPRSEDGHEASSPRRRWARWAKYGILLGAILAPAIAAWRYGDRWFPPPVPEIDLADATPQVAQGIEAAREAVVKHPRSGQAWGRLGMILQAHEYPAEAAECYRQAAVLQPEEFRWPYLLGSLLEGTDKEAASAAYRQAIAIQPQIAQLRVKLAGVLMELGQPDAAEPQLRRALELAPNHALARFLFARLLFQRQSYQQCLQQLEPLNDESPPRRAVVELLAQVYFRLGDREKAEAESGRLPGLAQGPDYWPDPYQQEMVSLRRDSRWLAYQAKLLLERGEVQATIDLLTGLVAEQPDDRTLREQLARAYIALNRLDLAAEVLDEGIRRIPDSFEMRRLRGAVHIVQNQWQQAAERFREAIAIEPDDAASHQDLGVCLLRLGAAEDALDELRQAVRYKPDLIEARIEMARLLLRQGQRAEAERELQTVLKLSPGNPTALGLLEAATGQEQESPPSPPEAAAPGTRDQTETVP